MGVTDADVRVALEGSPGEIGRWVTYHELVHRGGATAFITHQSYLAASSLVAAAEPLVHRCIAISASVASTRSDQAASLLHLELAAAVASPWLGVSGSYSTDIAVALTARLRSWLLDLQMVGRHQVRHHIVTLFPPQVSQGPQVTGRALAYVAAAAMDQYVAETDQADYQYKLERVRSLLGLRPSELARLVNVTREGLRQWQSGAAIAADRRPDIDQLYDTTMWFAEHIVPQALPSFVRRRVPVLNHQTVLDWLAGHRFEELRRIYERGFSGEVTG